MEPRVVIDGLTFPEAPRWREGRLWFSDFYSHRVIAMTPDGRTETIVEVPDQPSGLGWLPDGDLLIVAMLDRRVLRLGRGGLATHGDLSGLAGGPCNDMVVARGGRAYVGNFGYDRHGGEAERPADLARVDPDGAIGIAAEGLAFPNGSVITPDGATLVVAETFGRCLTAWDIGAEGGLSNQRLWADLGDNHPDGICLDADGAIWVADPRGNETFRVRQGGEVTHRIDTGERGSYACMLGGEARRTLYICTNRASGPAAAEARQGRIEAVEVDVAGAGLP